MMAVGGDTPWDRVSRHYHRQLWLEHFAVRTAVDLLDPAPGERLLDVATGTGAVLRALRERAAPPRSVTGVDSSAAMLAHVGALPQGWSVRVGDARALPFEDGAFDAVSASYVLHVVEDLPAVLAEIRRVLRPGGRLVTVTPGVPPRGPARPLARALDRLADRGSDRYLGLRALDPRAALERAGLTVDESRWSVRGYPSLCLSAHRRIGPCVH